MPSRLKSSVGETIRGILIANSGVTTLIAQRVYPNELPPNATLPAIVYNVVSDVPENSFTGLTSTTTKNARVQVDCYASPTTNGDGAYKQVHALARAVELALGDVADSDLACVLEDTRDLYDNVTQYHRVSMDFSVWR